MRTSQASFAIAVLLSAPAFAHDWIVDASGARGDFTDIAQAMAASSPRDRILVMPGSYPAFHFSRGVSVIGLGTDPGDVVIARVDFHPTVPILDFDTALENVTVCGGAPADGISFGGNELSSGTIIINGVRMCGGAFVHGAGELYMMVVNSRIDADPGDGFLGAAFDFGGGTADIVDSLIQAANASPALGLEAGVALRIGGYSKVRISGSEILGGSGSGPLQDGGVAIDRSFSTQAIELRLSGESRVLGGAATGSGTGGAGVDLLATIQVGEATVTGGSGAAAGAAYGGSSPTFLAYDPHLALLPAKAFAQGDVFLRAGDSAMFHADPSLPPTWMGVGSVIDDPALPDLSPLVQQQTRFVPGSSFGYMVPLHGTHDVLGFPGRRMIVQGFFIDPLSGATVTTNPVVITAAP